MFLGPLDAVKPWVENGVKGVYNFLNRVTNSLQIPTHYHENEEDQEVLKSLHATIKKVGHDIEALHFNTAISQMMIFTNLCIKKGKVTQESAEAFIRILVPLPHTWPKRYGAFWGTAASIAKADWPVYDESLLQEDTHEYPVMINGKLRFKIVLPLDLSQEEIQETGSGP